MSVPPRFIRRFALLALTGVIGAGVSPQAGAQDFDDPRIDPKSGRDLAHWPHARPFDHLHMRLELDIPDMNTPRLTGRETLTITPIGVPRASLRLDAERMTIRSVAAWGRPQSFTHDNAALEIWFDRTIDMGESVDVIIDYGLDYPSNNGVGMTWTPGNEDGANATARAPQIHTQGQPESNRLWFPCHDFPNDRLTTELIVTLQDGFEACSNGRLVEQDATGDGRVRWHWRQEQPIANYLVVLVVGVFDIVQLDNAPLPAAPDGRPAREIPLRVFTTEGTAEQVRRSFERTPEMVTYFSELFGEPFPYDKYDQLIVRNFAAGAMENASATTFAPMFSTADRATAEDVIAHELVHQWFGDLITYKSWEHTWLSEGWATFGEALWAEASAPEGRGRRAYQRNIARVLAGQAGFNRAWAPRYPGMVSRYYSSPDSVFMKTDNVYSKGALVLHMLRMRLGDEVFFAGVRLYVQRFRERQAETGDFRRCLEEASGESLERFFDQWAMRPGLPRLTVDATWDDSAGVLRIRAEQTQRIDTNNPAYAFELPIVVKFQGRDSEAVYLPMDTRIVEQEFPLDAPPTDVSIDPGMTVAAPAQVTKSLPEAESPIPDEDAEEPEPVEDELPADAPEPAAQGGGR